METIPIKFSLEQILAINRQLPISIKKLLIQEWILEEIIDEKEMLSYIPNFGLENFNKPLIFENHVIKENDLSPLQDLWNDTPTADELCKMLNA